ncbi:transcription factor bHLH162-like isoform X2 [Aristolochia californica]|uniref:transcription factor bHLH162-like isoform X2 n=1 Tax=Aristolochia californica TaxID=171875 RepID=UPI0035D5B98A
MDRKTIEKDRRIQMKTLFAKLNSLVPQQKVEQAAIYIEQSQTRIKKLKERKEYLLGIVKIDGTMNTTAVDSQPPQIEIRHEGSALMVSLVGGLNSQCMLYKSIRAAEEEGAEVVNAGSAVVGDKIYHIIHAEVTDAKQGFQASRISERLKIPIEEFQKD